MGLCNRLYFGSLMQRIPKTVQSATDLIFSRFNQEKITMKIKTMSILLAFLVMGIADAMGPMSSRINRIIDLLAVWKNE
jgi:hypothetical protein